MLFSNITAVWLCSESVGLCPVLLQIMQFSCVQQALISTSVNSSTFTRGAARVFCYYSLGGDTAMPGGL